MGTSSHRRARCACRNVLHWHILDSSSFPVKSLKFPKLSAKGAYSSAATYSLDELRELVAFAKGRGVRIVRLQPQSLAA